jgi:sodium pump decarboxylase gamma subunit
MKMPFADAVITAILGYGVVFVGLVLLMCAIILMGKVMTAKKAAPAAASTAAPTPAPKAELPAAPGSAGEVALYDVPDKDAAMLMAIVADKMGKPLNELRFKSIKEVK